MEDLVTRVDSGPAPVGSTSHSLPPQIGPYTILKLLGEGGMGIVYAAYDAELDRKVAIKLLHPRPMTRVDDSDGTRRLLREAQAMAKISHPNVLQVFEADTHGQQVYVVLEHVEGTTLRTWWKQRPRGWQEVLQIFLQIGEGLHAAHEAGVIHRDLKPDNILIDTHDRARVMDFGLARSTGAHGPSPEASSSGLAEQSSLDLALTVAGSVVGTPAYMPPEQSAGLPLDARCDQFSFCVSMWEALHGERPFSGSDRRTLSTSIAAGRIRDLEEPRSPSWLRAVLARGLAADPQARFASMVELLAALRADPRIRLRRALLIALLALLTAAGLYGYVLAAAAEVDVCDGGPERFAAVWGPEPAATLAAAFTATGRPHAPTTAADVREGLDRYAATWIAMYGDTCATSRRGEQSDDMLDRRMACLERRRGEVAAQVELFAAADGTVVDRAIAALQGLTPVATCGDPVALAAKVTPPDNATVRAEVDEIQRELDGLEASVRAGRSRAALPALELLSQRAEALAYPPVLAEVALLRGTTLAQLSQSSDAETWLFRALWLAEAERHDEVAARAWTELVRLIELQGERDASARWADGADAAITRLGDPARLRARLLNNRGVVALAARQLPAALELFTQALRLRSEQLADDEVEIANTLNNLGNVLMLLHRHSEARATHERALALRERLLGRSHPDVAGSCLNLGGLMEDDEETLRWYARASEIWRASAGPDEPRLATVMVNTANIHVRRGATAEARRLLEAASELLTRTVPADNPTLATVRVNLAGLQALAGEYTAAAAMMTAELARRDRSDGMDDARDVELRTNLAAVRIAQGDYDGAEPLLRHNLDVLAAIHGEGSVTSLGSQLALLQVQLRRKRLAEAADLLRAARARCDGLVDKSEYCPVFALHEADLALLQRDPGAALRALRRAPPDDPHTDPLTRAEHDLVRGQILSESGADRAEGQRIVAAALALLRTVPEFAPARIAEMQAWLTRDAQRRE